MQHVKDAVSMKSSTSKQGYKLLVKWKNFKVYSYRITIIKYLSDLIWSRVKMLLMLQAEKTTDKTFPNLYNQRKDDGLLMQAPRLVSSTNICEDRQGWR